MDVGELCSRTILSLGPSTSLRTAATAMTERRVGSAVVILDDGRPGIITERDMLRAVAEGADPGSTPIERYMTTDAITASASWEHTDAARSMLEGGFRHLLVMTDNGMVGGVLSIRDLLGCFLDHRPTERTKEEIS